MILLIYNRDFISVNIYCTNDLDKVFRQTPTNIHIYNGYINYAKIEIIDQKICVVVTVQSIIQYFEIGEQKIYYVIDNNEITFVGKTQCEKQYEKQYEKYSCN